MPIKDRAVIEPMMARKLPPPAPFMWSGVCSDCGVAPIICADGDMKACPRCYAVLWKRDYSHEMKVKRDERLAQMRALEAQRRETKKMLKRFSHIFLGEFDGRDHRCF